MAENNLPTLTYFPLHAKAEPIRMLLKQANVAFNDKTMVKDQFLLIKDTLPAGQLPIWVESDGTTYNQAAAILRLLGRKYNFYAEAGNDLEAYYIDWALETYGEFWNHWIYKMWLSPTEAPTDEKLAEGVERFVHFNNQIEAHFAKMNNAPFFAGDRMTIADFVMFSCYISFVDNPGCIRPECQAALAAKMEATPLVQAYIGRMKTAMPEYMAIRSSYRC